MKSFRELLETVKAGNFFRTPEGDIIEIEKIEGGVVYLKDGKQKKKKHLVWTGKKKDGKAIWLEPNHLPQPLSKVVSSGIAGGRISR